MKTLEELLKDYDHFIFDLYGTLIDIRSDERADSTWERFCVFLDELGIKHPDKAEFRDDFFELDRKYRERRTDCVYPEIDILEVYDELFERYGNGSVSDIPLISYKFREISREYMRLMPGVDVFIDVLKNAGKKIYILSNAQASYTLPEIQHFELDRLFDDYRMSSDYGIMKPERAFFDMIVKENGMQKERTVMFGDSFENDCMGAKNAGMDYFHVSNKEIYEKLISGRL